MRCAAVAISSGMRCKRAVVPGARYGSLHLNSRFGGSEEVSAIPSNAPPLPQAVTPIESEPPAGIGIEDEIAMLRYQIREARQMGDSEAVRRGIETLVKAVKVQRVIMGRAENSLTASLAKVLEEVGAEVANGY